MRTFQIISCIGLVALLAGCRAGTNPEGAKVKVPKPTEVIEYNNPPAEGFDLEGSDAIAILLADQVMNSMGGREKWDQTAAIYWNFFGSRQLLWHKAANRVRIDIPATETVIALNMNDMTGKVWNGGELLTDQDSLQKVLEMGHRMWINDSYWLVMPFKLKDSGVTLTYVREDTTRAGERSDVLRLTFKNVGVTPDNAYEIWVSVEDRLVKQWAWFREASQTEPNFVLPWTDYQNFDGLLISGERGDRDLTDIKVLNQVAESVFTSPDKPAL